MPGSQGSCKRIFGRLSPLVARHGSGSSTARGGVNGARLHVDETCQERLHHFHADAAESAMTRPGWKTLRRVIATGSETRPTALCRGSESRQGQTLPKYRESSQSVTALLNCSTSKRRVAPKYCTNSSPRYLFATSLCSKRSTASERVLGTVGSELSA